MESKHSKLSELMGNDDIFFQAEIKIGPFKLLDTIGKGKFATVSLGIHEETKEKVAIKQIKKSELNTDNLLTKEINILKILFHPYLTKMYCVIEKDEDIFIITEYCSKGDVLNIIIENGAFEESKSCKIFQQILSSLEYLHNNNICHRDIKPENILLDEYDDAKLSDFGLSKKYEKNEFLKSACGSPMYAAPEMLLGKPYKGNKIDIWSLGISLYTMVCGDLPFDIEEGDDLKTLVYNITHGKYTIPEFISPSCQDLIKRILEINPDKRINIDEIKKHEWVNSFNFNYLKSPGVLLDEFFLPIDIYLVKDIKGENENEIKKMIEDILMNKHNKNTINYYLKNEIKKRKGEKSISDLRATSELFLQYINDKKSKKIYWNNDIKKIGDYYMKQITYLIKNEKIKQSEIKKEIKDSLKIDETNNNNDNDNENRNGNIDKKNQMIKFKTELKLNNNNNEENKEVNKNIKKDINENKKEEILKEKIKLNDKQYKLEIVKLYIGPLIFIHDLIDNIITKAINIVNDKQKKAYNFNYSVSSSIKMEITNTHSKTMDNEQTINTIELLNEETDRKMPYQRQRQFSINKADIIELVSTPKKIKNSFSYINKVQSENIEINSIKKTSRARRSESCEIKNDKNDTKLRRNLKTRSIDRKRKNSGNKKIKVNKNIKEKKEIIKSVDLSSKGYIYSLKKKRNILKNKNKSYSNIKHLQINIIKNEIIINIDNKPENDNIKKNNEIGLIKNYSQNYSFDINKTINLNSKLLNKKSVYKNNSITKNRNNKIPISKYNNRSVDLKNRKSKKDFIINVKKNKNFINIKKEILSNHNDKKNINNFLNGPILEKNSSNISIFFSPKPQPGRIKNSFINNKYSHMKNPDPNTTSKKEFIQLRSKKNKNIILLNNIKKDFTEYNPISNKYSNNFMKIKKFQEKNNQHNSQLLSLFSQPNENEDKSNKKNRKINKSNDINIAIYKYSQENENMKKNDNNSRKNIFSRKNENNNESKILKTDISNNSQNKRKNRSKNNNDHNDKNDKNEDIKLIKTKLSLDKIKQIIKKYVGNNVVESRDNGNFKFICKTKFEKDDLIFHLELISKTYDTLTLKGILVKGETRYYKELLYKIKEKLN